MMFIFTYLQMQLQRLWFEGQHIGGIPQDQIPDLKCCLLYQHLQVINCCITRKRRLNIFKESLDPGMREHSPTTDTELADKEVGSAGSSLYARISTGELVLRLGADHPSNNLYMLDTGEPIYSPVTQVWLILFPGEHHRLILTRPSLKCATFICRNALCWQRILSKKQRNSFYALAGWWASSDSSPFVSLYISLLQCWINIPKSLKQQVRVNKCTIYYCNNNPNIK